MNIKKRENDILIALIRTVLFDNVFDCDISGTDWKYIFEFSKFHKLENIVYYAIEKLGLVIDEGIYKNFFEEHNQALLLEAYQQVEAQRIGRKFSENNIKHIFLKGMKLKNLYPKPDMRYMLDADLLVEQARFEDGCRELENLGYISKAKHEHHDLYILPPNVKIEIHRILFKKQNNGAFYDFFADIWNRTVKLRDDEYEYEFTPEDFFVYLLAHDANHFFAGGIGIRTVVDLAIIKQHYGNLLDNDYVKTNLKQCGIEKFAFLMQNLADTWFLGENKAVNDRFAEFLLTSGRGGTTENLVTLNYSKHESKFAYFKNLIFRPYDDMKNRYRWLEGKKYLIPFAWCCLWGKRFTSIDRFKHTLKKVVLGIKQDNHSTNEYKNLFDEIGMNEFLEKR